jgi:hypothetical protein
MDIGVTITDTLYQQPIAGVVVAVYDSTGAFFASGTTDALGHVVFGLPGAVYDLRFYKLDVEFGGPYPITVTEPNGQSEFAYEGTMEPKFGVPTDPGVCRCVGRFLNFSHGPASNLYIRLTQDVDLSKKMPKLVGGNFVSPSAQSFHTDGDGYVVMDLPRGGEFFIMVAGEDDQLWTFKVPDRETANLIDLMQVRPVAVVYGATTVSVQVGATVDVPAIVSWTDTISRPGSVSEYVTFASSDETVAVAVYGAGEALSIKGLGAGSCTVTATATPDTFPRSVPATSLTASPLTVTVTP